MYFKRHSLFITLLLTIFFFAVSFEHVAYAGTLSCSITTSAACTDTVILRMSGSSNAHAELPSQANGNYDGNVICCSGVTGLGNSCSGTFDTVLKLSGTSNAHVEQNSQVNYANDACMSVPSGGTVSVGYQAINCSGFDTTLSSMKDVTNSHIGNTTAYTEYKVCATATGGSGTLTFSISDNSIGFGTLSSSTARYATGDTTGSASETVAHTIAASTNASSGYVITVQGGTLTFGGNTITAIGGTSAGSSSGSEQYGLRITASGGNGSVTSPYNHASNYAYAADVSTSDEIASDTDGDDVTTTYSIRYLGNVSAATEAGSYTATMTYLITANF
jgi:hypothetical protein